MNANKQKQQQNQATGAGAGASRVLMIVFVAVIMALLLVPFAGMLWARNDDAVGKDELAAFPQLFATADSQAAGGEAAGTTAGATAAGAAAGATAAGAAAGATAGAATGSESLVLNVNFLPELGAYFEDHYAFRSYLIDANSRLYTGLLSTSPVEKAIFGQNGWLYFNGTLEDYMGLDPLTSERAAMIAHNLSLVQEYTQAHGGDFLFCVAPNKNSLYAENMPTRYHAAASTDWGILKNALQRAGVSYIDLHDVLQAEINANPGTVLYYRQDTHWNALGARVAYNSIMDSLGLQHESYATQVSVQNSGYEGDIAEMLYPVSAEGETEFIFNTKGYKYLTSSTDIENDGWVVAGAATTAAANAAANGTSKTTNDEAGTAAGTGTVTETEEETGANADNGTLLMFRDSFTNALFPFLAGEFETSFYSKLTPYNLANVDRFQPNHVVIELAQRNLSNLYSAPPAMVGISRNEQAAFLLGEGRLKQAQCSVKTEVDGDYTVFTLTTTDAQAIQSVQPLVRIAGSGNLSSYVNYVDPFWLEGAIASESANAAASASSGLDVQDGSAAEGAARSYVVYLRTDTLPTSGMSVGLYYS